MAKKILCLCSRGNSRSVCLAWMLKDMMGLPDVIASGLDILSDESKKMLCDWADKIIVVDETLKDKVPEDSRDKMVVWDVGGDKYFRGFEQELIEKYANYINKEGI